jgi:hypothetical protein
VTEASADSRAPALFGHCQATYEAMLSEATRVREGDVAMVVWEGFPTKLLKEQLRLSTPYYTSVLRALKRMGSVKQLRRGGSTLPSQWELLKEPDLVTFLATNVAEPSAQDVRLDGIEQMIRDLTRRLERVEVATGVGRVPIDFISDPTPPGGIRITDRMYMVSSDIYHENGTE